MTPDDFARNVIVVVNLFFFQFFKVELRDYVFVLGVWLLLRGAPLDVFVYWYVAVVGVGFIVKMFRGL